MESNRESAIKRFSGDVDDPHKEWRRWKRWARAHLVVQRARGVPEEALGSLLFTLLDGSALRAFDSTNMDLLEQAGGQDIIFDVLDDRYPEEAAHDRLGEVLDTIFNLKVDKAESTATYTGKVRAAVAAAEAEGVTFPSVARGYLLLRFSRLGPERKAVVMAAARQSYEEADIAAALRTTYPEGLYQSKPTGIHVVDEVDIDDYLEDQEISETLMAQAGEGPGDGDNDEPIEEQDAIDILLSWKQTRVGINKTKLSRGFGGQPKDFKKLEARVKCFKCHEIGHFSRNCPRRSSKKSYSW